MSKAILSPATSLWRPLCRFFSKICPSGSCLGRQTPRNPFLYVGGGFYVVSALVNIWVLHYMEYSALMPMLGITYIWTLILSCLFLKEKFTLRKLFGIACIVAGAAFIGLH